MGIKSEWHLSVTCVYPHDRGLRHLLVEVRSFQVVCTAGMLALLLYCDLNTLIVDNKLLER